MADATVRSVDGPDPSTFTAEELAERKRLAALTSATREKHAWEESLMKLEATSKPGNNEKVANTQAQIAALNEKIAALKG
jgi:hypothetical protein